MNGLIVVTDDSSATSNAYTCDIKRANNWRTTFFRDAAAKVLRKRHAVVSRRFGSISVDKT